MCFFNDNIKTIKEAYPKQKFNTYDSTILFEKIGSPTKCLKPACRQKTTANKKIKNTKKLPSLFRIVLFIFIQLFIYFIYLT